MYDCHLLQDCAHVCLTLLVLIGRMKLVQFSCRVGLNDEECSGRSRGECNCGKCTCYIQEELLRTVQALLIMHVMLHICGTWFNMPFEMSMIGFCSAPLQPVHM